VYASDLVELVHDRVELAVAIAWDVPEGCAEEAGVHVELQLASHLIHAQLWWHPGRHRRQQHPA
jgi:hypothetical protein